MRSNSGSSYPWGIPRTKESVPQNDAAAVTRPKTSFTGGRSARSVLQHSSNNSQTLSERPSSRAFVGLGGLSPLKILCPASDSEASSNGSVPVSTYTGRINVCARIEHRVVCTWYMVIAIACMSASFEGMYLSSPNMGG